MLKCKKCSNFNDSKSVKCKSCNEIIYSDGIYLLDDGIDEDFVDFDAKCLDQYYSAEKSHFWFRIRNEFIYFCFKKFINKESRIIEIGAGTGAVTRFLIQKGYNVAAGDIHLRGLKYAQNYGVKELYLIDVNKKQMKDEFDVVCLFDVIEHIDDDSEALKNVGEFLKKDGKLVITVPAHQWLWNGDDDKVGHKRRYVKKELENLLTKNGYEIDYSSNFFIFILPLLFIRSLVNKNDDSNYEIKINVIINFFIYHILRLELFLLRFFRFSFGGSILIIAGKK